MLLSLTQEKVQTFSDKCLYFVLYAQDLPMKILNHKKMEVLKFCKFGSILIMPMGVIRVKYCQNGGTSSYTGS